MKLMNKKELNAFLLNGDAFNVINGGTAPLYVHLTEHEDSYDIHVEAPSVKKEDINLVIDGHKLSIFTTLSDIVPVKINDQNVIFPLNYKVIDLSKNGVVEEIDAVWNDKGYLSIHVPIDSSKKSLAPRKINIRNQFD